MDGIRLEIGLYMDEMKVRLGDYTIYNLYNWYTWSPRCSLSYNYSVHPSLPDWHAISFLDRGLVILRMYYSRRYKV